MATAMWSAQRVRRMPATATFPAKLSLLRDAAVRKCDALDGVTDGIISKPSSCTFDPVELLCKPGAAAATCLSAAEVAVAHDIYAGPKLASGKQLVPGFPPGSEYDPVTHGWEPFITENGVGGTILGGEFFRWLVFQDPNWVARSFQLDRDYAAAHAKLGGIVDAVNPDLGAFTRRGGKLLIYHGWEDPVIPAGATVKYYEAVRRRLGARAANSVRFFMLPGVGHCAGGHGPSVFDKVETLDRWVSGTAVPDRLTVGKYDDDMAALAGTPAKLLRTRLVCSYPRTARYKGHGSIDKAESYVCTAPTMRR
jgi:feruloyl esterase